MTATGIDRAIEAHARRQHGAFNTKQAYDLGATPRMVRRRAANGRWTALAPTVWTFPSALPTWHRQVMAAVLSLDRAVVSGLAAGHLHELEGFRTVRPELTVPHGRTHHSPLATVHQSDRAAVTRLGCFPVVTVEQALYDSAGRLGQDRIDSVVEAAVVTGKTTPGALLARAAALVPNPPAGLGCIVAIAEAMAVVDDVPASALEALLFRVLRDPRIPLWVPQASLPWRSDSLTRLDVLIPEWRLIVEADGRRWHTRRADFEKDRLRDQDALAHDHSTVRFTHHQLEAEPALVLDTLLRIGAHRSRGLRQVG